MFHEYDVVKLKQAISSDNSHAWPIGTVAHLNAGAIGTVVMTYPDDSTVHEYEVEFLDEEGKTLALLMLKQDELELVQRVS
jgi:hypothetical protein